MIKNEWLDEAEAEGIAYFRAKLFTPINSRYLDEARVLENRWSKLGLLNDDRLKYSRAQTAVLLESQRLCNEL